MQHLSFLFFLLYCVSASSFRSRSVFSHVDTAQRLRTSIFVTTDGLPESTEERKSPAVKEEKPWMIEAVTKLGDFVEERNVPRPVLYTGMAVTGVVMFYELSKFLMAWSIPMLFAAALFSIAKDKMDETSKSVSNTVTMGFMKANSVTANSDSITMVFPYVLFTALAIGSLITAEELHLSLPFDVPSIDLPRVELPFALPSIPSPSINLPSLDVQLPTVATVNMPSLPIQLPSLPSPPSLELPSTVTLPIVDVQYCVTVDGNSCQ